MHVVHGGKNGWIIVSSKGFLLVVNCEWFQESCVECSCAGVEALQFSKNKDAYWYF